MLSTIFCSSSAIAFWCVSAIASAVLRAPGPSPALGLAARLVAARFRVVALGVAALRIAPPFGLPSAFGSARLPASGFGRPALGSPPAFGSDLSPPALGSPSACSPDSALVARLGVGLGVPPAGLAVGLGVAGSFGLVAGLAGIGPCRRPSGSSAFGVVARPWRRLGPVGLRSRSASSRALLVRARPCSAGSRCSSLIRSTPSLRACICAWASAFSTLRFLMSWRNWRIFWSSPSFGLAMRPETWRWTASALRTCSRAGRGRGVSVRSRVRRASPTGVRAGLLHGEDALGLLADRPALVLQAVGGLLLGDDAEAKLAALAEVRALGAGQEVAGVGVEGDDRAGGQLQGLHLPGVGDLLMLRRRGRLARPPAPRGRRPPTWSPPSRLAATL